MRRFVLLSAILSLALCAAPARGQGVILPGAGPVNRAMGGVATAAAVDPIGANLWNPAVISGLPGSQFGFGLELIYADTHLASTVPAGAVTLPGGIGLPPETRSGETRSDSGLAGAPSFGLVWHPENFQRLTLGLITSAVVGGSVNFPGDPGNPVLSPTDFPKSFGVGPIYANLSLLASGVNMAYQVTDRLSVGLGGTATTTSMSLDPAFFAGRDDANGDLRKTFPAATHSHPFWGGGFQAGLYYRLTDQWNLGFGYKSPLWQEEYTWRSSNEIGEPLNLRLKVTYPAVYSWGVAYTGLERTIIATDLRFIDYKNTDLFGEKVIDGGLGWQDVFAVAVGAQHWLTDRIALRVGYLYNDNPIPNPVTLFNTQAPGIIQHTVSAGTSLLLNDYMLVNLAYVHGFQSTITGPILQVDGANVALSTEYDSIVLGFTIRFGPRGPRVPCPCPQPDCVPDCGPAGEVALAQEGAALAEVK